MKKKLTAACLAACLMVGSVAPAHAAESVTILSIDNIKCKIFKAFC